MVLEMALTVRKARRLTPILRRRRKGSSLWLKTSSSCSTIWQTRCRLRSWRSRARRKSHYLVTTILRSPPNILSLRPPKSTASNVISTSGSNLISLITLKTKAFHTRSSLKMKKARFYRIPMKTKRAKRARRIGRQALTQKALIITQCAQKVPSAAALAVIVTGCEA